MYFPGIDEIKHLHHHKGIEDEGKMARVHLGLLKYREVIVITFNSIESTTADSPSNYSVSPFKPRIEDVFSLIVQ